MINQVYISILPFNIDLSHYWYYDKYGRRKIYIKRPDATCSGSYSGLHSYGHYGSFYLHYFNGTHDYVCECDDNHV
ncbi:hypothetical protein I4U23_031449 [Adineta vaga]|nr:hypothetical protein I4U23_031449 [Adineta vaga]